jgi:hypothetical protein
MLLEKNMVTITIIAESSFGYKDQDHSIEIPDSGDLDTLVAEEDVPNGKEPEVTVFAEYLSYTSQRVNRPSVRSFPAVNIGNFYMLWMEKRKGWVGIKYNYLGCQSELDGNTETIETAGPFKLDERCAELIRKAYGAQSFPLEKVLHAEPSEIQAEIRIKH